MIDKIYAALPMRTQTENASFLCKDDCTLTKHTWRWTYSAIPLSSIFDINDHSNVYMSLNILFFLRYTYWVHWHIYAQFTCACYYLYYKEQYCLMLFCNHEMHQNSQNLQSQALMSSEQDLQKIGGNIITAILRFMWGILCTFTVRQSWFLPVWIFIMILIKYKTN